MHYKCQPYHIALCDERFSTADEETRVESGGAGGEGQPLEWSMNQLQESVQDIEKEESPVANVPTFRAPTAAIATRRAICPATSSSCRRRPKERNSCDRHYSTKAREMYPE